VREGGDMMMCSKGVWQITYSAPVCKPNKVVEERKKGSSIEMRNETDYATRDFLINSRRNKIKNHFDTMKQKYISIALSSLNQPKTEF
jgi:hypothetical protein